MTKIFNNYVKNIDPAIYTLSALGSYVCPLTTLFTPYAGHAFAVTLASTTAPFCVDLVYKAFKPR